ncbi:hypothetical protein CF640_37815, partial [Burkholderia pseudomallei]
MRGPVSRPPRMPLERPHRLHPRADRRTPPPAAKPVRTAESRRPGEWVIVALTVVPSPHAMSSNTPPSAPHSPLYLNLLGQTAKMDRFDLERFFAQGKLFSDTPD